MSATLLESWAPETNPRFERMLRLAGAAPEAAICTAGRSGVELMITLCKEGYVRVECLRQATCACSDGGMDILAIAGGTATESVVGVLLRTAAVLRDGGVVVLQLDALDDDCAVQAALASQSLEVSSTVFDLSDGVLVAHTVQRTARQAIAS